MTDGFQNFMSLGVCQKTLLMHTNKKLRFKKKKKKMETA